MNSPQITHTQAKNWSASCKNGTKNPTTQALKNDLKLKYYSCHSSKQKKILEDNEESESEGKGKNWRANFDVFHEFQVPISIFVFGIKILLNLFHSSSILSFEILKDVLAVLRVSFSFRYSYLFCIDFSVKKS